MPLAHGPNAPLFRSGRLVAQNAAQNTAQGEVGAVGGGEQGGIGGWGASLSGCLHLGRRQ